MITKEKFLNFPWRTDEEHTIKTPLLVKCLHEVHFGYFSIFPFNRTQFHTTQLFHRNVELAPAQQKPAGD